MREVEVVLMMGKLVMTDAEKLQRLCRTDAEIKVICLLTSEFCISAEDLINNRAGQLF
jgi:hypothetical protein